MSVKCRLAAGFAVVTDIAPARTGKLVERMSNSSIDSRRFVTCLALKCFGTRKFDCSEGLFTTFVIGDSGTQMARKNFPLVRFSSFPPISLVFHWVSLVTHRLWDCPYCFLLEVCPQVLALRCVPICHPI